MATSILQRHTSSASKSRPTMKNKPYIKSAPPPPTHNLGTLVTKPTRCQPRCPIDTLSIQLHFSGPIENHQCNPLFMYITRGVKKRVSHIMRWHFTFLRDNQIIHNANIHNGFTWAARSSLNDEVSPGLFR